MSRVLSSIVYMIGMHGEKTAKSPINQKLIGLLWIYSYAKIWKVARLTQDGRQIDFGYLVDNLQIGFVFEILRIGNKPHITAIQSQVN
jgi:hypothetical protein